MIRITNSTYNAIWDYMSFHGLGKINLDTIFGDKLKIQYGDGDIIDKSELEMLLIIKEYVRVKDMEWKETFRTATTDSIFMNRLRVPKQATDDNVYEVSLECKRLKEILMKQYDNYIDYIDDEVVWKRKNKYNGDILKAVEILDQKLLKWASQNSKHNLEKI